MTEILIGGHRGMDVMRITSDTLDPLIVKRAKHELQNSGPEIGKDLYDHNLKALMNEARMLRLMEGSGYAPRLWQIQPNGIAEQDVGDTEASTDMELWRRNCVFMLAEIRARGLRHGDLIGANIITRGNHPYAIDWQEGHLLTEPAPQKQPWSDSSLLMRHIAGTYGADGQLDTPRVARRWGVVLGALGANLNFKLPLKGKSFLDLGCFQGDFVALAAAEGMKAYGIDLGGFRSGEDSIQIGQDIWRGFPFGEIELIHGNIMHLTTGSPFLEGFDIVMMFSTWPYIVRDFGWERACDLLVKVISNNEVLFFETQLAGDGPGPSELPTDEHVELMLRMRCGASVCKSKGTFPVTNRPNSRTIWEVRK